MSDQQDRLAEIKARLAASTPQPWWQDMHNDDGRGVYDKHDNECVAFCGTTADAAFIAHAAEDITWLIIQIEEAELQRRADMAREEGLHDE